MKTFALILLSIFLGGSAWAAQPAPQQPCLGSDPQQRETLTQFSWRIRDPQLKADFCDPKSVVYRVARAVLDLKYVDSLKSTTNSTGARLSGSKILSASPFEFFSSRINTFVFEPNEGTCAGLSAAYVHGVNNGVMHICRQFAQQDDLTTTSVLIHEARHQDQNQDGYFHVECKHGIYAGYSKVKSCDDSYSTGGAYAAQTEFLIQISRTGQLNPSVRQSARSLAIEQLVERFNTLPLDIQDGAVIVSDKSELLFYDGEKTSRLHSLPHRNIRLIKENGILNFYDPAKKTFSTLADGINLDPNEIAAIPEASDLIDHFESKPYDCWLFPNRVTCDILNRKVTLPIKEFTPIGFWNYDRIEQSQPIVVIASKEGRFYTFSENSKTFKSQPTPFQSADDWNEQYLITLDFNGKIWFLDKDQKAAERYVSPQGLNADDTYTKLITPFFWSKKLQEL